jgi:signal peptidase I
MANKIKQRQPLAAALLSLFMMGLGQLYNGQPRRAAVFFAIAIFPVAFLAPISHLLLSFQGIMAIYAGILITVGIRVFAIIDAFIGARRIGMIELRRYNRWYVYVSVILVIAAIQSAFELAIERPVIAFSIPSGAMQPTLLVGDYVSVDKDAYAGQTPERGDIVVFRKPPENETDYVMRIVGLPGERIQMVNGVLHIDGEAANREPIEDFIENGRRAASQYIETLPGERQHRILETSGDQGFLDNTRLYTVPGASYFLMGDNRDNSADSRVLGPIPEEKLVGKVRILYFSISGGSAFWQVWKWPSEIRYDRIGSMVN